MNRNSLLLYISASVEALTGIVTAVSPSTLVWLLWAVPLTVGGLLVARLTGFALISLAVACWPLRNPGDEARAIRAMLVYNVLAALYLLIVGARTQFVGVLLWPAVVFHATMSVLFILALRPSQDKR